MNVMRTSEYMDGREAFEAGNDIEDCPFKLDTSSRSEWIEGWADARLDDAADRYADEERRTERWDDYDDHAPVRVTWRGTE